MLPYCVSPVAFIVPKAPRGDRAETFPARVLAGAIANPTGVLARSIGSSEREMQNTYSA